MKPSSISTILVIGSVIAIAACVPKTATPTPTPTTSWYKDADNDTYGDATNKFVGDKPDNTWVSNKTDCDDSNANIHPNATEIINKLDDDCDGIADNGIKYIFITSLDYAGAMGGLAGADNICQSRANASTLPTGTYKAWLSSSTVSAASRLNHSTDPYYRADGVKLANNWADLIDGTLNYGITINENGSAVNPPSSYDPTNGNNIVWTGTLPSGEINIPSNPAWTTFCLNWNSSANKTPDLNPQSASNGYKTYNNYRWSNLGEWNCADKARLYCLQQ
jgi:hypothetical protein